MSDTDPLGPDSEIRRGPDRRDTGRGVFRAVLRGPAELLVLLARVYQCTLSSVLGGQCRFVPSCSEYFIQAVTRHGALRGGLMGLWRVLRCNPFCRGGYDPVR